jgi:hypothetical protein
MRPRARALVLLCLAAAVAATFAEAISTSSVFYQRDIQAYWYPHMAVFRRAIAEGSWPVWNPWVGFGAPLLADATFELAYPPTWLALVLPPAVQFKLVAVGHCLLAALGACALARRLGLGWTAAGTAGIAYALSGPFLSAASLFHHYAGAAWLPWLLFTLEGLLRRPGPASALRLGLVAGVQILAGSGDVCLAGGLLGSARLGLHLARRRPSRRHVSSLAGSGALAVALALAVGAVQWLPTAARAREGYRSVQDARTSAFWSLHPAVLADLAVPRLVTDLPLSAPARQALFEGREPLLACLYLGLVPLALGSLGLALRPRLALPPGAGLAFFLVAALGRHTPAYGLLLALPGFGLMRYPQKFLWPAALCAALVAAVGAQAWSEGWSAAERTRARGVAVLLLAAALSALAAAWWVAGSPDGLVPWLAPGGADHSAFAPRTAALKLARSAILALLVALVAWRRAARERGGGATTVVLLLAGALDLVAVGRGVNPLAPPELLGHRPPVLDLLPAEARLLASIEGPRCLVAAESPAGWEPRWIAALGLVDTLRPPSAARWGLRGSYDGEFTGLGSPWSAPFTAAARRLGTPEALRLLQAGGVSHVLRVGEAPVAGLERVSDLPSPYVCPLQVWRVPETLPGAYVVHGESSGADAQATLGLLLDPAFDPRREVILADARADGAAPGAVADEVHVVARRLDALEVEARLGAPGVLVVLEAYEPGWIAAVDGAPAPVLRANGLFRAVRLGTGRHLVRLAYRPPSVRLGAALGLLGLASAAGLALAGRAARRAPLPDARPGGSIAGGSAS